VTRTVKRILVGAAVVGLVATAAPPALANAAGDSIRGGCFLATVNNAIVTGGHFFGVIGDLSFTTGPNGLPTDATVTCFVRVNGVVAPGTTFSYSGHGVQDGADEVPYTATDTDVVTVCQRVTYGDLTTEPESCTSVNSLQVPPQEVTDILSGVEFQLLDPILCPIFSQLYQLTGGGVLGVLRIDWDGDLYAAQPLGVGYVQVYDCPPYGNGTGSGLGGSFPLDPTTIHLLLPPL
jgi:hypothetical protein